MTEIIDYSGFKTTYRYESIKSLEDLNWFQTVAQRGIPINGWLLIRIESEDDGRFFTGTATFQKLGPDL